MEICIAEAFKISIKMVVSAAILIIMLVIVKKDFPAVDYRIVQIIYLCTRYSAKITFYHFSVVTEWRPLLLTISLRLLFLAHNLLKLI
jgi:hypothetical protein